MVGRLAAVPLPYIHSVIYIYIYIHTPSWLIKAPIWLYSYR